MLSKVEYLKSKQLVKFMNEPNVRSISEKAGLTEYELNLLLSLQKDKTRTQTCYELCISEYKYRKDMLKVLTKIYDFI